MKITIEIGPNKITRFLSRIRYSIVGLKKGWREYQPNRNRNATVKAAKNAAQYVPCKLIEEKLNEKY